VLSALASVGGGALVLGTSPSGAGTLRGVPDSNGTHHAHPGAVHGAALEPAGVEALVAPLTAGATLGPWKVEQLLPLSHGAASLVLSDAEGVRFQLDVCARDSNPDAPLPPACSEFFDVFLANGGKGSKSSFEHHGLAAMAIADVIRQNEQQLSREGFATLSERIARTPEAVRTV
jgi:hypothetical protein